jgi:hypothetical protein
MQNIELEFLNKKLKANRLWYDMIFYLKFYKSTNKNKVGYRTWQE